MPKRLICILLLCALLCCGCETTVENGANAEMIPELLKASNDKIELKEMIVESHDFAVTIDVSTGIRLTSIYDKTIDHEYVKTPARLFKFASDGEAYSSDQNLVVQGVRAEGDGYAVRAVCEAIATTFDLFIRPDPDTAAILIDCYVSNHSDVAKYITLTYPEILPVSLPGNMENAYVSIPQEGGWVSKYDVSSTLGFSPAAATAPTKNAEDASGGLPTCVNAMEVISVYNSEGAGGLFIADVNGEHGAQIEPTHMLVKCQALNGYTIAQLEKGAYCQLSTIAVGAIRNGDWHVAVDYYTQKREAITQYPQTPAWLREAGAIYSANNGGAGGNYLMLAETSPVVNRLGGSFQNMSALLTSARKMGTNVVLLVDWYDNAKLTPEDSIESGMLGAVTSAYYNKGDYLPREDLGGEAAFKAGIEAIHQEGGKIIVYVEPFVVFKFSEIGREKGELWAARNPQGELDGTYAADYSYSMSCALDDWRAYLVDVCVRLVEEYGVDGIYFDSMGNQWNHSYYTNAEGRTATVREYNEGFIAMCTETREAIQAVNPDAVVLCEAGASTAQWTDGGLSGDFLWGNTVSDSRILASPVRYGIPEANLFITGETMSQLKQCYAAGYNLALSYYWEENQSYIRQLVTLRQKYKDALIYGEQEYQPRTQNTSVVAYSYSGIENTVLTVLNLSGSVYDGKITLHAEYANTQWFNELSEQTFTADENGVLQLSIENEELMVLSKVN